MRSSQSLQFDEFTHLIFQHRLDFIDVDVGIADERFGFESFDHFVAPLDKLDVFVWFWKVKEDPRAVSCSFSRGNNSIRLLN